MKENIDIIAGALLIFFVFISYLLLYVTNKEHRKQMDEMISKTRNDWLKAFDATDELRSKEANALKDVICAKDEVIAEKEERIKQLEVDIALKDMVMACAGVDGNIDFELLKQKLIESSGNEE